MDIEKFLKLPESTIGRMIGDIKNLDWMDFENLKDDVTVGTSINKEVWFIVLKCRIQINKFEYRNINQCFHQFHKNFSTCWVSNDNCLSFINGNMCLTPIQLKLIERLIDGEIVTLQSEHWIFESSYCGKKIATCGTWKKKRAVDLIERNWLICRYNPKYTMCGDVLMHNIGEAREEYENSIHS